MGLQSTDNSHKYEVMSRSFHLLLAMVTLSTVVFSIYGTRAVKLAVPASQILLRVGLPLIPLGFAYFYRWRRVEKLKNLLIVTFWGVTLQNLSGIPIYIAARQNVPLRDDLLAELDCRLGLEVPDVLRFMELHQSLKLLLDVCYETLILLIILALALPVLFDKLAAVKEYFVGCIVSVVISIPLFAYFQAVGPWHYYGYAPDAEQERTTKIFFALKSDEWIEMRPANSAGVVAFPSFHTILAVLSAIALWRIAYVRWFAALLASLIVVSTVTTGWHYLSDVWAGLAIAVVSFFAARGYSWIEALVSASGAEGRSGSKFPPESVR
jgi:membrane-associated phospholipid phosphatase